MDYMFLSSFLFPLYIRSTSLRVLIRVSRIHLHFQLSGCHGQTAVTAINEMQVTALLRGFYETGHQGRS
jgi:hypothetical protein